LNGKIEILENNSRTNQDKLDGLLKEKNELTSAFEETRNELARSKGESEESNRKYSELYSNHTILQIEQENLQKDLRNIKTDFKSRLIAKTKIIEQTFEKKVESLRKQKDRV
jgi:chromosome segregation ATPase